MCRWEDLVGPFLVHKLLGPRPPPPLPRLCAIPPPLLTVWKRPQVLEPDAPRDGGISSQESDLDSSLTAGMGVSAWMRLGNGEGRCPPPCGPDTEQWNRGSVGITDRGRGRYARVHLLSEGGGGRLDGLLSEAGGAHWPLATSPCPLLEPCPLVGGGAHGPVSPEVPTGTLTQP